MKQIELYNGVQLPDVGFGTFPYKEELFTSVPAAYNSGYRLFDTSDNYANEQYLGKGLQDLPNDIFIVTKFSKPCRIQEFSKLFNISREKIGRPIDLYLVHWPYEHLILDIWREMEKLYIDKEVRAIGVCNFEVDKLNYLMDNCDIKPMVNQIELHPKFQQKEISQFCQENNIQIMSYSPLARMNKDLIEDAILMQIASAHAVSVPQVILRWNLQHNYIAIPSTKTESRIKANYDIWNFSLSDEEINLIDNLDCGLRVRFDPKTRFDSKKTKEFYYTHINYNAQNKN